jgi:hypothetical protein
VNEHGAESPPDTTRGRSIRRGPSNEGDDVREQPQDVAAVVMCEGRPAVARTGRAALQAGPVRDSEMQPDELSVPAHTSTQTAHWGGIRCGAAGYQAKNHTDRTSRGPAAVRRPRPRTRRSCTHTGKSYSWTVFPVFASGKHGHARHVRLRGSALHLRPNHKRVGPSTPFHLTARLFDKPSSTHLAGELVTFYYQHGSGPWKVLRPATTNSAGVAVAPGLRENRTTQYLAVFDGPRTPPRDLIPSPHHQARLTRFETLPILCRRLFVTHVREQTHAHACGLWQQGDE